MKPPTRYAQSGEVNIAYQVFGDAPRDLVVVPGWVSNIDAFWEEPACARFFGRLSSFARVVLFDKRGTGLSDRVPVAELPTLEQRMDDVRAVLDAVDSERAALYGYSEGGPMCALFAATDPERTTALIMEGGSGLPTTPGDQPTRRITRGSRRSGTSGAARSAWRSGRRTPWPTSASGAGGRPICACPPARGPPSPS